MSGPDISSLRVSIPEEFRDGLSERFRLKNAKLVEKGWDIDAPDLLCKHYRPRTACNDNVYDEECPFRKFSDSVIAGCVVWFEAVILLLCGEEAHLASFHHQVGRISWSKEDDPIVRTQLAKFWELAFSGEELIEWV